MSSNTRATVRHDGWCPSTLKKVLDCRPCRPILKQMLEQTIDLDRTFQALADRSRRSMVERLTSGPASVSELARPLSMSLAAVVQHVQVLEACGVVKTEKVGRTRLCRIEPAAMTAAEQWITDRRRGWEARLDRLGDVLNEAATTEENA